MWKRISEKEYSCLSTDVKQVTDPSDAEGILEGSTLMEVQADNVALKGYLFYQGGWRGGSTI